MGGFFAYVGIAASTAIAALVLAVLLGAMAALVPAARAARLNTVERRGRAAAPRGGWRSPAPARSRPSTGDLLPHHGVELVEH